MPTMARIQILGFLGGLGGLSKNKIRVLGGLEELGGFTFKKHFTEKIKTSFS
jgi:hypothetical protein